MRIGIVSTRLSGTDGVSLEVEKWSRVLQRMGHEVFYCAGELSGYAAAGTRIPKLHFAHEAIWQLTRHAFDARTQVDIEGLIDQIYEEADNLRAPLRAFLRTNRIDLLIVQNALTIPMNLPLGVCLTGLIAELGIPTIAHHHDFFWERERYQTNRLLKLLDTTFPAQLPTIRHVTINSIAQQRLKVRRGIESVVIPNVHDFGTPPPGIDAFNRDVRSTLGLRDGEIFILQPTRVIRRKGIEMALELVARLGNHGARLFITHSANDEGQEYWHWLHREARLMGVHLRLVDDLFHAHRSNNGRKVYSLWDAYPHADLVTYPSIYEGFGNGLLEAVYFQRPTVVNRYPVFVADIEPLGFEFITLDGYVSEEAIQRTRDLLADPSEVQRITRKNFEIAREHFSLEVLEDKLRALLADFS
ncbi:MAG: glycosyltransferase [Anaerolineae bacterium]|nr:MAG: glycosyltransferase [Anaerolineae bacterium]